MPEFVEALATPENPPAPGFGQQFEGSAIAEAADEYRRKNSPSWGAR